MRSLMTAFLAAALMCSAGAGVARAGTLVLAATTSVLDSGLFQHLIPKFTARTGHQVEVVSRASTGALMVAEQDGADVVIVNDPDALTRFVEQRHGVFRRRLMSNDFLIVGPRGDPAKIGGTRNAPEALRAIAKVRAPYVSRADQSGTHAREQKLWARADIIPKTRTGNWLRETGMGMGASLAIASKLGAYILTDRATFIAHRSELKLEIMVAGDPDFFNQYEIVMVAPARHPSRDAAAARELLDWMTGPEGQAAIGEFKIDGEAPFHPNAS